MSKIRDAFELSDDTSTTNSRFGLVSVLRSRHLTAMPSISLMLMTRSYHDWRRTFLARVNRAHGSSGQDLVIVLSVENDARTVDRKKFPEDVAVFRESVEFEVVQHIDGQLPPFEIPRNPIGVDDPITVFVYMTARSRAWTSVILVIQSLQRSRRLHRDCPNLGPPYLATSNRASLNDLQPEGEKLARLNRACCDGIQAGALRRHRGYDRRLFARSLRRVVRITAKTSITPAATSPSTIGRRS